MDEDERLKKITHELYLYIYKNIPEKDAFDVLSMLCGVLFSQMENPYQGLSHLTFKINMVIEQIKKNDENNSNQ